MSNLKRCSSHSRMSSAAQKALRRSTRSSCRNTPTSRLLVVSATSTLNDQEDVYFQNTAKYEEPGRVARLPCPSRGLSPHHYGHAWRWRLRTCHLGIDFLTMKKKSLFATRACFKYSIWKVEHKVKKYFIDNMSIPGRQSWQHVRLCGASFMGARLVCPANEKVIW